MAGNLSLREQYTFSIYLTVNNEKLFYFIFDEKLPFSKNEPYPTVQISSVVRLFEGFTTSNTQDVEMAGIEPACKKRSHKNLHT